MSHDDLNMPVEDILSDLIQWECHDSLDLSEWELNFLNGFIHPDTYEIKTLKASSKQYGCLVKIWDKLEELDFLNTRIDGDCYD